MKEKCSFSSSSNEFVSMSTAVSPVRRVAYVMKSVQSVQCFRIGSYPFFGRIEDSMDETILLSVFSMPVLSGKIVS